jgi:hypothetical protein
MLLSRDLLDEQIPLPAESFELGGVDILAIGGELVGRYGEKRLPLLDLLPLLDMNGFDGAFVSAGAIIPH